MSMKTLLAGAVGMLALQVLLVGGYLAVSSQDPIILNPDRANLDEGGVTMAMLCGDGRTPQGRGSKVLEEMPPTET
jgi:hypothetical protein